MKNYHIHPLIEADRVPLEKTEEYEILAFPRWIPGWIILRYTRWKYHRYMKELEKISEELINKIKTNV